MAPLQALAAAVLHLHQQRIGGDRFHRGGRRGRPAPSEAADSASAAQIETILRFIVVSIRFRLRIETPPPGNCSGRRFITDWQCFAASNALPWVKAAGSQRLEGLRGARGGGLATWVSSERRATMTIRNLEHTAAPASVVVLGASEREGSVGRIVLNNIVAGGFAGEIWPVNPKYDALAGRPCYRRVADVPGVPELAIIVTPPGTVPGLIDELGRKGTRAAVVITAGITRQNGLRQQMLEAAKPYLLRIIGPNTVGLIVPPAKLNASFSHMSARPGGLALLSQSGAIATSLIDWTANEGIGFSRIVSLGDMADVDVGDCLDMLAGDAATRAILMYLETIPNARKFMSAARAAARIKPVIAIKSGRHAQAAKAAATHTGALSGGDKVVDAAMHRAGILRVRDLAELFDAAETLARFRPLQRSRVGIVTNGGGAGVLAVDRLVDLSQEMAELSPDTIAALDAALPANWSHANPVDIIGDAPPERYEAAVRAVAKDPAHRRAAGDELPDRARLAGGGGARRGRGRRRRARSTASRC